MHRLADTAIGLRVAAFVVGSALGIGLSYWTGRRYGLTSAPGFLVWMTIVPLVSALGGVASVQVCWQRGLPWTWYVGVGALAVVLAVCWGALAGTVWALSGLIGRAWEDNTGALVLVCLVIYGAVAGALGVVPGLICGCIGVLFEKRGLG